MHLTSEECAREILEVVPLVMRSIRAEMRSARAPGLNVPQFRTLVYLNRNGTASLSDVAAYIGLMLPSASTLVDGLVSRDFVAREPDLEDRRRITLRLTGAGHAAYQVARQAAEACLIERVALLGPDERAAIMQALGILRPIFSTSRQED
jgi:DNA-binding MarR family transcriptional regulator